MTQREEWREIPGYNYAIDISTKEGRCKNLKTGRILSNRPNKGNGRIIWCLAYKKWQAARWIALAYPELVENEYFEGAEIDHKDTDSLNNHPSNLRWVTHKGNMNNPLTRQHKKSANPKRKRKGPFPVAIEQFNSDGVYVTCYKSIMDAHKKTGICRASISMCCNGKLNKAGGYLWKYKEKEAV